MKARPPVIVPLVVTMLAASMGIAAFANDDESTRQIMARIVEALEVALPPSFDEERFGAEENRGRISAALRKLAADGARLEHHATSGDASFAFLSHSLASDSREISRRYDQGHFEQSSFLLHHLTEVCAACHSRLPDDHLRQLGRKLVRDEAIAALPLDERARYEIATRQFDRALASLESHFADPNVSPGALELTGQFEDYLEVSLRVRRDPERALQTLKRFRQRDDVPVRVRSNVDAWIASLEALRSTPTPGSPLEHARQLLDAASKMDSARDERDLLVNLIAASGDLNRFIASQTLPTPELGYAYYLLGAIDTEIGRSFWASQAAHFLETAIRIAPSAPYAEPAYELYEAFVVAGYTGSGGERVPPDVRNRLHELRALLDRSKNR